MSVDGVDDVCVDHFHLAWHINDRRLWSTSKVKHTSYEFCCKPMNSCSVKHIDNWRYCSYFVNYDSNSPDAIYWPSGCYKSGTETCTAGMWRYGANALLLWQLLYSGANALWCELMDRNRRTRDTGRVSTGHEPNAQDYVWGTGSVGGGSHFSL